MEVIKHIIKLPHKQAHFKDNTSPLKMEPSKTSYIKKAKSQHNETVGTLINS